MLKKELRQEEVEDIVKKFLGRMFIEPCIRYYLRFTTCHDKHISVELVNEATLSAPWCGYRLKEVLLENSGK